MSARLVAFAALPMALAALGCGGGSGSKFPARPEGCEVEVFPEAPPFDVENIGSVRERCDSTMPDADCLRGLKDQVCRLGGDVVWGVDKPNLDEGYKRLAGRAAKKR